MNSIQQNSAPLSKEPTNQTILIDNKENKMNGYFYSVFHFILLFVAIYLFINCGNPNGSRIFEFLIALFCPLIYIIYIIATRGCSN